ASGASSSSWSLAGDGSRRNGRATKTTAMTAIIAATASAHSISDSRWSGACGVARCEPALLDRVGPHRDQRSRDEDEAGDPDEVDERLHEHLEVDVGRVLPGNRRRREDVADRARIVV